MAGLRGNEEYLNLLDTVYPASITANHANNALQTFERIATLIKKSEVGRQLDIETAKLVLYTTLDVAPYFKNRKLVEIFMATYSLKRKWRSRRSVPDCTNQIGDSNERRVFQVRCDG